MPGTTVVWYSDHHLVKGPLFRPSYEYRSDIQMPGTMVIVIVNHFYRIKELRRGPTIKKTIWCIFCSPSQKKVKKNFYSRRDLNPGPRPQSKFDDLDRLAIGPGHLNSEPFE